MENQLIPHIKKIEYVKNQIENTGYKLLSNEYENANTKLKIQCSEGHQYNVRYNNFQQGKRCPICDGTQKLTYNFIKQQFDILSYIKIGLIIEKKK